MYTVIILNKHSAQIINNFRFLFKPFVDEGVIGFCNWNESGTDVKSSVPDLYSLIKGKKEWRAVILNLDSMYGYKDSPMPSANNPFDYSCIDSETAPHESPIPLIRITHIIGGYNVAPIREFEKGFEFFDEETGKKKRVKECDLSDEELEAMSMNCEDIRPVFIEKETPPEIVDLHNALANKYLFSDARPVEIDLVSMRQGISADEKTVIINSWKNHLEMSSSDFWDKNHYPNTCRFLVYDIFNPDNSLFQRQLIEFWLSVLALSVNKIPASALQAYRIYKIHIDINSDVLASVLNSHLNRMYSAYAFVKEQMQLRPEYSFDENEEILESQHIPVTIESSAIKDLYVNSNKIGLSRDCPEDEYHFWTSQVREKKDGLKALLKAPRRSIDKAASHLKKTSESFRGERYQLDSFQISDLNEQIDELEYNIISLEAESIIDRNKVSAMLEEADKNVKKEISVRMKKDVVLISGFVALFIAACGYIPYIISIAKTDSDAIWGSVLLVLCVMAATAVGGMISLAIQRSRITALIKKFNYVIHSVHESINNYAKHFEKYFSDICTYMKAQSILDGIQIRKQNEFSSAGILISHKSALSAAIERDSDWLLSYGLTRVDEIVANVTSYFNTNIIPRQNKLYYFEINHDEQDLPLNSTGDTLTSPYKFIKQLWIEREDIYDEEGTVQ